MSIEAITARVVALEARMAALEARGGSASTTSHSGGEKIEPLRDEFLSNDWANKEVYKDPPRWKGEPFKGRRLSECSAEWHDENAGFKRWAFEKGKADSNPKMSNKLDKKTGQPVPFYERDRFDAALSMAWARRIRANGGPQQVTQAPPAGAGDAWEPTIGSGDSEFPF